MPRRPGQRGPRHRRHRHQQPGCAATAGAALRPTRARHTAAPRPSPSTTPRRHRPGPAHQADPARCRRRRSPACPTETAGDPESARSWRRLSSDRPERALSLTVFLSAFFAATSKPVGGAGLRAPPPRARPAPSGAACDSSAMRALTAVALLLLGGDMRGLRRPCSSRAARRAGRPGRSSSLASPVVMASTRSPLPAIALPLLAMYVARAALTGAGAAAASRRAAMAAGAGDAVGDGGAPPACRAARASSSS